jgi:pilus assembly protein Flp/PilA
MTNLITRVRALLRDEEGQDLIEYALLAGLIALVSTLALTNAGTEVKEIWEGIETELGKVPAAAN